MTGPFKVSVSGPLEEFAGGFLAELAELGYAPRSSEAQMRLMKHLSGWLATQGLTAGDLTAEVTDRFVAARRRSYSNLKSPKALVPLLAHLRRRGVAPPAAVVVAVAAADVLSERFAGYLSRQRGLAPDTVRSYLCQVRPFLVAHAGDDSGWASLTARQVDEFVTDRAVGQRPRSVAVGANALRALLRWMWREGLVPLPLAESVGSVAAPTGTGVPRSLSTGEVADLLAALPADGPARLRDEAMIALMCRLGLRAGEVASLVPLHPSTTEALRRYATERARLCPRPRSMNGRPSNLRGAQCRPARTVKGMNGRPKSCSIRMTKTYRGITYRARAPG